MYIGIGAGLEVGGFLDHQAAVQIGVSREFVGTPLMHRDLVL